MEEVKQATPAQDNKEQESVSPIQEYLRSIMAFDKYNSGDIFENENGQMSVKLTALIDVSMKAFNEIFTKFHCVCTKPGVFVYYSKVVLDEEKKKGDADHVDK